MYCGEGWARASQGGRSHCIECQPWTPHQLGHCKGYGKVCTNWHAKDQEGQQDAERLRDGTLSCSGSASGNGRAGHVGIRR